MNIIEQHRVPVLAKKIRLQEYAAEVLTFIPTRSALKKAIKRGQLLLDGAPATTADWMREGQLLELLAPPEKKRKVFRLKLSLVFEDDFLALIDKPAGYPTNGNYFKTIENALPFNLKASSQKDALAYPVPVHRLDNPTTGLLLIAKTMRSKSKLQQQFEQQDFKKSYLAVISGELPEEGVYTELIEGKTAETRFTRIRNFEKHHQKYSLVNLVPHTGRTHQLRKHLAEDGYPIVGDQTYGATEKITKGILLYACSLEFTHPITREKLSFSQELPPHFKKFIAS